MFGLHVPAKKLAMARYVCICQNVAASPSAPPALPSTVRTSDPVCESQPTSCLCLGGQTNATTPTSGLHLIRCARFQNRLLKWLLVIHEYPCDICLQMDFASEAKLIMCYEVETVPELLRWSVIMIWTWRQHFATSLKSSYWCDEWWILLLGMVDCGFA